MSDDIVGDWHFKSWSDVAYDSRRDPHGLLPIHYSIASYCTERKRQNIEKKPVLIQPGMGFNNFHFLSAAMQKNLGDSLPQNEPSTSSKNTTPLTPSQPIVMEKPETKNTTSHNTPFSTITNFVSSVFNVISTSIPAMPFHKRAHSLDTTARRDSHFDECVHDGSPPLDSWPTAKSEPQNKNNCSSQSGVLTRENNVGTYEKSKDMSVECRAAAAHCEDKLNKVRTLLTKTEPVQRVSLRPRRPKKVFVEPNSIQDDYENLFEDKLTCLVNSNLIECVSVSKNTDPELTQVDAPVIKTEMAPLLTELAVDVDTKMTPEKLPNNIENIVPASDIKQVSEPEEQKGDLDKVNNETEKNTFEEGEKPTCQLIQSCEDKVGKLRALLQERRKNNMKSILKTINYSDKESDVEENLNDKNNAKSKPVEISKSHNKRYKNHHRSYEKRKKCQMRKHIKDDMNFGNEIDVEHPSSVESSPKIDVSTKFATQTTLQDSVEDLSSSRDCYFNEVAGRFRNSSTTESEDSFQIVFADEPKVTRSRKSSDCDSEDSFIIFEGSADNCYTSTDVFGDEASDESDCSDSDSDADNQERFKLTSSLSRTISDLTDDSLYEDSAVCQSKPYADSEDEVDCGVRICKDVQKNGLVTTASSKESPDKKKVRFSEQPPKVHVMCVWSYAARQARIGNWEQFTRDRDRFKRRIADADMAISWVLKPQHRKLIKFQRFMPWWNAQRRQEIAEKKAREEEEKKREEEERIKREHEEKLLQEKLEEERKIKEQEQKKIEDVVSKAVRELKRLQRVKKKSKVVQKDKREFTIDPDVIKRIDGISISKQKAKVVVNNKQLNQNEKEVQNVKDVKNTTEVENTTNVENTTDVENSTDVENVKLESEECRKAEVVKEKS